MRHAPIPIRFRVTFQAMRKSALNSLKWLLWLTVRSELLKRPIPIGHRGSTGRVRRATHSVDAVGCSVAQFDNVQDSWVAWKSLRTRDIGTSFYVERRDTSSILSRLAGLV